MAEDQEKTTDSNFSSTIGAAFIMGLIGLLYQSYYKTDKPTVVKDFIAGFDTISDAETDFLIGLSTSELRQRLGKPDNVIFSARNYPVPRTSVTSETKPDETWVYFSKVNHKASGTKMSLTCDIRDGKCIAAKSY